MWYSFWKRIDTKSIAIFPFVEFRYTCRVKILIFQAHLETILFCLFQVIHGLLDRTMQLLEVPYSEDKTSVHGYYLKAHEGTSILLLLIV